MSQDLARQAGPVRVLIVDDAADVRTMLRLMLNTSTGFDVIGEAANGRVGVELAGSLRPDIVLLDLAMPLMDGLEALPLMVRAAPNARIVVFSGFAARDLEAQARALGAHGYVTKGARRQELLDTLSRALKGSH